MKLRMLEVDEVRSRIDGIETKIAILRREKSRGREIGTAEAEKAVWERVLHHIARGQIITVDDEGRIHWHKDAPTA